ncbi:MAG TPA: TylF/MycF/NovP-related O-methyltransferase [Bryobacteraceae bacterium]|nr:TylF/MycF/NovP-related O-methyltransferase [Bryobacteraceae bacterium]
MTKQTSDRNAATFEQLGHHAENQGQLEGDVIAELCAAFENSCVPLAQRLQTFPRHVRRQDLARFLVRYELFKLNLGTHGSIVECGVFAGGGLMTWSHCSAILEPYNHTRRVIGFDTFTGFPHTDDKDTRAGTSEHLHPGGFKTGERIVGELQHLAEIHDKNRPLGHIPKIELVQGDGCETIPLYIQKNPHLLISLLYLDFDLYEPTKSALQHFLPRVVRGGIVAFDELNSHDFPGETLALLETLGDSTGPLCRFPADPHISYFVK